MAAGPLPLRAPCTGAGGPLRARPAAEVSTFCSCGVAIFSQRKKRAAVGLTLVMLPACHCAQRAHPGLCHGLHGTTAWGNNLSREGRGSTACHALRKGRNGETASTSSPFLALPAGHGIVGGQRDKGVEAVLSALQWSSSQPVLELSLLGERLSPPLCFPAQGCIPITGRLRNC